MFFVFFIFNFVYRFCLKTLIICHGRVYYRRPVNEPDGISGSLPPLLVIICLLNYLSKGE